MKMSTFYLPVDLWLEVLSYLDFEDLVRCSYVNKQLNELSEHASLWRPLCKKYWSVNSCSSNLSWKENFARWYDDMGRYIQCYVKIKKAWDQISDYMKENCAEIHASINPGATDAELDAVEASIRHKLPTDLRCSYRIHNGQKLVSKGLLGSVFVNDHYRSEVLLDIETAAQGLKNKFSLYGALPLTLCVNTGYGYEQMIALSDAGGQILNQVFAFEANERLSPCPEKCIYITSKSFTSWLTDYACSLIHSRFTLVHGEVFKFYREPECVARTGSIWVTAGTCFLPEYSTAGRRNWHSYEITMNMDEDAYQLDACQLETRHWIVIDEDGREERVDGPGVVGEFPILRPGSTFSWASATHFKTTHGSMKGHFTMRNLKTGKLLEVECPVFHMKCPPYIKIFSKK